MELLTQKFHFKIDKLPMTKASISVPTFA
jgi:hypothetical protein